MILDSQVGDRPALSSEILTTSHSQDPSALNIDWIVDTLFMLSYESRIIEGTEPESL